MDGSKVTLSDAELSLAMDPDVMLLKNKVVESVYRLFGRLAQRQSETVRDLRHRYGPVFDVPPKISKGERYRELPYVMLDHPRLFGSEDVFAVRTLFWWGHFFSVTLHLKGEWLRRFSGRILESQAWLSAWGFHFSTGRHEWEHHFEADNYLPVSSVGEEEWGEVYAKGGFTKLAVKYPIGEFNDMEDILSEAFERLMLLMEEDRRVD